MLFKLLVFITFFYMIFKILGRFWKTQLSKQNWQNKNNTVKESPLPYDPKEVEDVDYIEIKKKPNTDD